MNDFLLNICTSLTLTAAQHPCAITLPQVYNQSQIKPIVEENQQVIEKKSISIYETLPYNKPLSGVVLVGNRLYKKDYRIPLTGHIEAGYYNGMYDCNLVFSF